MKDVRLKINKDFLKEVSKIYTKKNGYYNLNKKKLLKCKIYNEIINLFKKSNFLSTSFTNINSSFQFYYLNNIWNDINIALKNNLKIIHFATEPIKAKLIYKKILKKNMRSNSATLYVGNMKTIYSNLWGLNKNYIQNKNQVLNNLKKYFNRNENCNI